MATKKALSFRYESRKHLKRPGLAAVAAAKGRGRGRGGSTGMPPKSPAAGSGSSNTTKPNKPK